MMKKLLFITALATSSFANVNAQNSKIATGFGHSIYICPNGDVNTWGDNSYGQLGLGGVPNKSLPEKVASFSDSIIAVSAGEKFTLFLKRDSTVWVCGSNGTGQLGTGDNIDRNTPVQIPGLQHIKAIAAGQSHSLFVKNDGTVWACGRNFSGQLGLGDIIERNIPTQVPNLNDVKFVSAGERHSLFLKNDGKVFSCGSNIYGQLGNPFFPSNENTTPIPILSFQTFKGISAGYYHSLFLTTSGEVFACGSNSEGEVGVGNFDKKYVPVRVLGLTGTYTSVKAGLARSLFLKSDGTIWACGTSPFGELGYADNNISRKIPLPVSGLSNIVEMSVCIGHSLFFKNDGSLWSSGASLYGELGGGEVSTISYSPKLINGLCVIPTPPTATMNMDGNGGTSASVCKGGNVNISATVVGSNPDYKIVLDNSIILNNPIAIDKNSTGVFVLNNNNSITKYNFNGTVANTYPNLSLSNIWAFTVDNNDNLYINNGSVNGSNQLQIHKCNNTGALVESVATAFLDGTSLITDMLYHDHDSTTLNMFFVDTVGGGLPALSTMNLNDPLPITNMGYQAFYNNKKYTSVSMDNFYRHKRLLLADPTNHLLEEAPMYNNQGANATPLIDPTLTAGMALDYIYADTVVFPITNILVSSRTKKIIGIVNSIHNADGSVSPSIDTSLTSYFNATAPVGAVLVKNGNKAEYWVADNGQNKLLRLSLSSYNITPTLPAGLIFNSVTGVIEGTPTSVIPSQTYTLTIYGLGGYTSSSTFTLGVTPSGGVSNATGTVSSAANQTDGTTKNYIDDQNCTQLVVITDFAGGTSPGQTRVEQTVSTASMVTVGNSNFVNRVTSVNAQQTENLNAKITFFYTYKDIKDFNTANPTNMFTNDTLTGSMPMHIMHMHETFDTLNSVWRKVPTYYGPLSALWIPNKHVWETTANISKLSEFYAHPSSIASTFNCTNSAKDTIVANDFYVWNYPDSLFASGDYVDTLINHTGCDSIVQLHLTINITTGLNEAALASGISVFPNPSNGVFNIRFNNTAIMPAKVKVISVIGTEVLNKTITSSDSIDLSPYESGIYFLSIENEGATKTWRIVKQ